MLSTLEIRDFRCIAQARVDFHPSATLICGPNASGKSSLLEAIFVLGRGRSFRTHQLQAAIRHGATAFQVVGKLTDGSQSLVAGLQVSPLDAVLHVDGRPQSLTELARALPVAVIDPEIHELIEDGPAARRRFLDWGVFHVKPPFIVGWRKFQRALRQRNSALKSKSSQSLIRSWDAELIEGATIVDKARSEYVEQLRPYVKEMGAALLAAEATLHYESGWREGKTLDSALQDAWSNDNRLGTTTVGPHRAELSIKIDGHLAKTYVSRGQQKLLAAGLTLAQLRVNQAESTPAACLLLDDPAAELDVDNLSRFFDQVARTRAQVIATALDPNKVEGYLEGSKFHVEQGKVRQLL